MSCLRRWKERKWNRIHIDNRGSSLALVMTIMAVVGILGAVLLSVTLVTFRMKETYMASQKNFYDAESVMDAIYVGLQQDVAAAAGNAYSWTLQNYSDADEEARRANYVERFEQVLLSKLNPTGGVYVRQYDVDHLRALVPDEVKNAAKNVSSTDVPLISSVDGLCALNQNPNEGSYTIRNLRVRFLDDREYMTEIRTDIVLTCPKIDFTQKGSEPMDLTSYVFVANRQTVAKGGSIQVNGNAYLGNEGTNFSTCTVDFKPTSVNGGGKLVTAGQFYVRNGASASVGQGYNFWAHEVYADSAASIALNGTTYLNDDLVIANPLGRSSVNVSLSGRLYAYGNPFTAQSADVFMLNADLLTDLRAHPANYSSAVLINGRNAVLDMNGLEDLIIAGNAYVATESSSAPANTDVLMGDSISLKASQRAYLVPAQYIAPYCVYGGMNPISADDYSKLQLEICDALGYTDVLQIQDMDYLRGSLSSEIAIPAELDRYHVKGIQKEVHSILTDHGPVNMVYFFLKFDSEADAMNFGDSYYAKDKNLSAMQVRVDAEHYNTKITYPSAMYSEMNSPAAAISDFTFYYNGSVLVPSDERANTKFVSGQCTRISDLSSQTLASKARGYQNTFAALSHALLTDYSLLTTEQRKNEIYTNLVNPMTGYSGADAGKNIAPGSMRVFGTGTSGIDPESQMCAVVVNGDYTLTGSGDDAYETYHSESLPLHLVIASGNVTVDCNYRGLIIAGGEVTFTGRGITVTADSNLAQQALKIPDASGTTPVEYLVNGKNYLSDTSGAGGSTYGQINYADYVTYHNWVKQ